MDDYHLDHNRPVGLYAFILGFSLTMLMKLGLEGFNNINLNLVYALFVGLAFYACTNLIPSVAEIIIGTYYETKKDNDTEEEPIVYPSPQTRTPAPDELMRYRDHVKSVFHDNMLRTNGQSSLVFNNEEAEIIYSIFRGRWNGKYADYLPWSTKNDPVLKKLERGGLVERNGANQPTKLTDTGKQIFITP